MASAFSTVQSTNTQASRRQRSNCTSQFRLQVCNKGVQRRQLGKTWLENAATTARPCDALSSASTAAVDKAEVEDTNVQQAVAVLKEAATTYAVPATRVFQALLQLEKKKLKEDTWSGTLGSGSGGRRWKLIFTSSAKDVMEGSKKGGRGGGFYFPLTAVQRWDEEKGEIENGIYLGQVAAFTFTGPYKFAKKKLEFDFTTLRLRIGPKWFPFSIPSSKKDKAGPFFLFFYIDDEVAVARGRGGGYALWQRTTAEWELRAGVSL